jgi:CheY-like chemotaxis protein
VLYIEDNAVNAILVTELLSCWPRVRLEVAPDGETGLRRAQALQPDVMLLDMQLPDMSGLAVMERLRADPATRSIKVMALSASAMPDEVAAARRAGAVAYWTKPIDFERFLQSLASQLPSADPRAGPQRSGESDSERPVPD